MRATKSILLSATFLFVFNLNFNKTALADTAPACGQSNTYTDSFLQNFPCADRDDTNCTLPSVEVLRALKLNGSAEYAAADAALVKVAADNLVVANQTVQQIRNAGGPNASAAVNAFFGSEADRTAKLFSDSILDPTKIVARPKSSKVLDAYLVTAAQWEARLKNASDETTKEALLVAYKNVYRDFLKSFTSDLYSMGYYGKSGICDFNYGESGSLAALIGGIKTSISPNLDESCTKANLGFEFDAYMDHTGQDAQDPNTLSPEFINLVKFLLDGPNNAGPVVFNCHAILFKGASFDKGANVVNVFYTTHVGLSENEFDFKLYTYPDSPANLETLVLHFANPTN